jgi:DNA-binding response OmpR family regulator
LVTLLTVERVTYFITHVSDFIATNSIKDTYPIKLQVSSMRNELRNAGFSDLLIETLKGYGYRLGTFPDNINLD